MGSSSSKSRKVIDADTSNNKVDTEEMSTDVEKISVSLRNPETEISELKEYVDTRIKELADEFVTLRGLQETRSATSLQDAEKLKLEHKELCEKHEDLISRYEKLSMEHQRLRDSQVQVRQVSSKISDAAIDDYVQEILSDPTVAHGRLSVITDAVEGAVYRKALKAALHALALAADSSHVQFVGHKVVFAIEPVEDESSTQHVSDASPEEEKKE